MLTLDRISSIEATRAVQPYTSVMYGVAPSAAPVRAEVKASEEDAQATQTKLQAQQQAANAGDTGQGYRGCHRRPAHDTDTNTRRRHLARPAAPERPHHIVAANQGSGIQPEWQRGYCHPGLHPSRNLRELRGTALRYAGMNNGATGNVQENFKAYRWQQRALRHLRMDSWVLFICEWQ